MPRARREREELAYPAPRYRQDLERWRLCCRALKRGGFALEGPDIEWGCRLSAFHDGPHDWEDSALYATRILAPLLARLVQLLEERTQ